MIDVLIPYRDALQRLKDGCPKNVPPKTKITNDAVSLEAGKSKGSIKKSRTIFAKLIAEIKDAAKEQEKLTEESCDELKEVTQQLNESKQTARRYLQLYKGSLAREASLIYEIFDLKAQLAGGKRRKPLKLVPREDDPS